MLVFLLISLTVIKCFAENSLNCNKTVIVTDFNAKFCNRYENEYFYENINDSCLPGCVTKLGKGESCSLDEDQCAPGLICNQDYYSCDIDQNSVCFKWQHTDLKWSPECLPDGSFAPKQCKGEPQNGRCFCYDKKGQRIFGEMLSNKAQNMTCACSRLRSELGDSVSLHCDTSGNFEPLQCDSDFCWCAEPHSGKVTSQVVVQEMMKLLPCYDKTKIGDKYLRQCESELLAREEIIQEFKAHGVRYINFPSIKCDWDGSYGSFKVQGNQVYCTWKDGSLISLGIELSKMNEINCNCARDTKLFPEWSQTKKCTAWGDYDPVQRSSDGLFYCVDKDGFAITDPQEDVPDCPSEVP